MISSSFVTRLATIEEKNITFDGAVATADADGALTVDGESAGVDDIILLKDQTAKVENGVFKVVDAGDVGEPFIIERWEPALGLELGNIIFVKEGSVNLGRLFVVIEAIVMVGSDDTCLGFVGSSLNIGKITEAVTGEGVDICVDLTAPGADTGGLLINTKRVLRDRLPHITSVDSVVVSSAGNPTEAEFNALRTAFLEVYAALQTNGGAGHGLFE